MRYIALLGILAIAATGCNRSKAELAKALAESKAAEALSAGSLGVSGPDALDGGS